MPHFLTRRRFLAASAALTALPATLRPASAQTPPLTLKATSRTLDIDGKPAKVFGLVNGQGGNGLTLDPGQRFAARLHNDLPEPTLIHWHGQIPPNAQDGVPGMPAPLLQPGQSRDYDFAARPGTYWMHSHVPLQEMALLAAPLIVRDAEDLAEDRQEVVILLHDFSFKSPQEVMAEITGGAAMAGMDHGMSQDMGAGMDMGAMGAMDMSGMSHDMGAMGPMAMDLNDYNFDAYLANDRTLSDPEVVTVEPGGRLRLRVINGAAATVFWLDTGAAPARLVAVDGQGVSALAGNRFGLAMGQRLDLEIDLPAGQGAYPILALREGARERTGLILATQGATVPRLSALAETAAPAFDRDLTQEAALRALAPLAPVKGARATMLMLEGAMQPYVWTINGATWADHHPVTAKSGERLEIVFHNMSMMGHPMHLHGHSFQVVDLGKGRFAGALRDTVYVPPMARVTVALDAGEAASWMLHCHHMPHLATGMMTEFVVS